MRLLLNCDFVAGVPRLRGERHEPISRLLERPATLRRSVALSSLAVEIDGSSDHGVTARALTGDGLGDFPMATDITRPTFGWNIFGHWLIDIIPRMLIAKGTFGDVVYLSAKPLPPFATPMLYALGLGDAPIVNAADAVGGRYCLLDIREPRDGDYYNRSLYQDHIAPAFRAAAKAAPAASTGKNIYLTRSRLTPGKRRYRELLNAAEVEDHFAAQGFEIVAPERHTFPEQIAIMRNADVIAGENGSALHNSLFMRPETGVINLQSSRQDHLIQATLCRLRGQHCTYVMGAATGKEWLSSYRIDPADLRETALA